jgi:hypothetical protein
MLPKGFIRLYLKHICDIISILSWLRMSQLNDPQDSTADWGYYFSVYMFFIFSMD